MLTTDQVMWLTTTTAFDVWAKKNLCQAGDPHPLLDPIRLNTHVLARVTGVGDWAELHAEQYNEMAEAYYSVYPSHRSLVLNRLNEYLKLVYYYVVDPVYYREEIIALHDIGHVLDVDLTVNDVLISLHDVNLWLSHLDVYPHVKQQGRRMMIYAWQSPVRPYVHKPGLIGLSLRQLRDINKLTVEHENV